MARRRLTGRRQANTTNVLNTRGGFVNIAKLGARLQKVVSWVSNAGRMTQRGAAIVLHAHSQGVPVPPGMLDMARQVAAGATAVVNVAGNAERIFKPVPKLISVPGASMLTTIYKTAESDSIVIRGKSAPLKHQELNRHRVILNNGFQSVGTTYGKAHWQAVSLQLGSSHLLTATNNLFGSDATQRYKFQTSNISNQLLIHNMDRVTAFIDFYVMVPAVDTSTPIVTALDDGAASARFTNVVTGTPSKEDLDYSPENAYTRRLWKVISSKHYKMEPGKTLKLLIQMDGFYPLTETRLSGAATHLKGQDVHLVWRQYAAPVRDAADNAVTLGTTDLICSLTTVQNFAGHTLRTFSRQENQEFDSTVTTQNTRMLNAQGIAAGDLNGDSTADDNDSAT